MYSDPIHGTQNLSFSENKVRDVTVDESHYISSYGLKSSNESLKMGPELLHRLNNLNHIRDGYLVTETNENENIPNKEYPGRHI